jgi:DNA polymerase III subunit beta
MKFICSQSDLNSNLSLVSRAVPSRPTHPVLGNVLLVADEKQGRVSLTAFDLSLGIRTSFAAQVIEEGSLTLPAKLLNDIVSKIPEGEITLSCELETELDSIIANLTSASGLFQVRGMSAEEFPELPVVEGEALMLPVSALLEGLGGSLFAASTDETKQILTGVHLTRSQNALEFAATDGHRLAVVQTGDPNQDDDEENEADEDEEAETTTAQESKDFQVTIPARALRELERILASRQENDQVSLHFDEGQVVFELGDQRITSRKLDGAYPNYNQLIPRQFSRMMTVERKRLLSSIDLVAVLADQKNNIVKFSLDEETEQLSLSVEAKDVGSAKQSMPAQIRGENIDIAFNVKYLLDGLKAIPSTEISMQLNENNQPVIFTPLGSLKMTYLVMPVQIRD